MPFFLTAAPTTGIVHSVGQVFQPIFHGFGWLLAFFYGLIPNYAVAIALLTLVIMGALTPLTVKSTKSMMAMQRLQPEMKKLQQMYKGAENRQTLNEEMMKLYKEEGANPLGGCLPVVAQAPFLFILYSVIKGLSNTVPGQVTLATPHPLPVSLPRYIPTTSHMYENLRSAHGAIKAFGMDLSLKPFSAHATTLAAIPFFIFVAVAVGLQYFQMSQMNSRNKKAGQVVPKQQETMQKIMPILFAYFYFVIPAAVVLYMVVSTAVRIATQDVLFRTGVSNPESAKSGAKDAAAPKKVDQNPQPSSLNKKEHPRSKTKRQRKDR